MPYKVTRLICIGLLFFLHSNCLAQSKQQIDSAIDATNRLYREGNTEQVIINAFTILKQAKVAEYEAAEVMALLHIADGLSQQGLFAKSNEYIEKLEQHKKYFAKRPYEHWLVQKVQLDNYRFLGLKSLFEKQFHVAYQTISSETDPIKRDVGRFNMHTIAAQELGSNKDTLWHHLFSAKTIAERGGVAGEETLGWLQEKSILYIFIGEAHLAQQNLDSALYYFNGANQILTDIDDDFYKADVYRGLGLIYKEKKQTRYSHHLFS